MLTELCESLRNFFADESDVHVGEFTISGGSIAPLDFLKEGQYFRIVGSTFNDGVHQYPVADMADETFTGAVWAMAVPPAVVALADRIKAYCESDAGKKSPFSSESFGGYSYTKATGANGAPVSWEKVFSDDMKPYRRMRVL